MGGAQHRATDGPTVHRVPEGSGERKGVEEAGCEIICGAQTAPVVW